MFGELLGYILQVATIAITLGLGLYSAYQTKKIQHGQNIVSVTTNYRMMRCEQLRENCQKLMTNTIIELLDVSQDKVTMVKEAFSASESISAILHRNFKHDKELIVLSQQIAGLALEYISTGKNEVLVEKLNMLRRELKARCDLYTGADWDRIKRETEGINTTANSWIEEYERRESDTPFKEELAEIKEWKRLNGLE